MIMNYIYQSTLMKCVGIRCIGFYIAVNPTKYQQTVDRKTLLNEDKSKTTFFGPMVDELICILDVYLFTHKYKYKIHSRAMYYWPHQSTERDSLDMSPESTAARVASQKKSDMGQFLFSIGVLYDVIFGWSETLGPGHFQ